MDERNVLPDSDKISVASDNTFFDIPGPQAEEATLSWRNDPLYNFSDWKLHIKIRDDSAKKSNATDDVPNSPNIIAERTYHVHRNILAIGERRSGYFANLLHYGIDDGNRCSSIELSSRGVDYFPDLLDYMYSSKAFAITTRNAIALLFLSQSFQVVALEARVKAFIEHDIRLGNFGHYMSDALHFSDETIAIKIISTCEKEAMLLMNDVTPSSVDLGLYKILKVPMLSSAVRAEHFCHGIWSFLTREQPLLQTKKTIMEKLRRRKAPR